MFDTLLVNPIINIVVALYHVLASSHVPYALGFAIILMTVLIKIVLYPLTAAQMKSTKKMQDMAPEIAKIKEKYKNDARQSQLAQMELFKREGVNPLAGCLPALLQIPVFIGLYWGLDKIVKVKAAADLNGVLYADWLRMTHSWDTTFFGLPLGKTPADILPLKQVLINLHILKGTEHVIPALAFAILLVPILTAGFQLIQSKMMMPAASAVPARLKDKTKEEDFAATMQKQMLFMMPLMIGFFSFTFPIGITLYWNTFTISGIIQQYKLTQWGGLEDWIKKIKK